MTDLSPVVAGLWKMHQWPLDAQGRLRWIERAVELGITSFDHADIYGGYLVEALFGEALALAPGLRQRLQIVTKCGIRLPHPARPGLAVKHYDSGAAHLQGKAEEGIHGQRAFLGDGAGMPRSGASVNPKPVAPSARGR